MPNILSKLQAIFIQFAPPPPQEERQEEQGQGGQPAGVAADADAAGVAAEEPDGARTHAAALRNEQRRSTGEREHEYSTFIYS